MRFYGKFGFVIGLNRGPHDLSDIFEEKHDVSPQTTMKLQQNGLQGSTTNHDETTTVNNNNLRNK